MKARDPSTAQALAYVDECLAADERVEFEQRLAKEPELAARVEQWRRQNEAIRRVFAESWRSRQSRKEIEDADANPSVARLQIERRETRPLKGHRPALSNKSIVRMQRPPSLARRFGRGLAIVAFGLAAWAMSVAPTPVDRATLLNASALSAYRTYATGRPVDLATAEPAALERWLRPQVGAAIVIPNFAPAGFTLVGGRVTAGAQGPAAFALYQNSAGGRVSLLSERGEPTVSPSLVRSSGDLNAVALAGFGPVDEIIVANLDEEALIALARLAASQARSE